MISRPASKISSSVSAESRWFLTSSCAAQNPLVPASRSSRLSISRVKRPFSWTRASASLVLNVTLVLLNSCTMPAVSRRPSVIATISSTRLKPALRRLTDGGLGNWVACSRRMNASSDSGAEFERRAALAGGLGFRLAVVQPGHGDRQFIGRGVEIDCCASRGQPRLGELVAKRLEEGLARYRAVGAGEIRDLVADIGGLRSVVGNLPRLQRKTLQRGQTKQADGQYKQGDQNFDQGHAALESVTRNTGTGNRA